MCISLEKETALSLSIIWKEVELIHLPGHWKMNKDAMHRKGLWGKNQTLRASVRDNYRCVSGIHWREEVKASEPGFTVKGFQNDIFVVFLHKTSNWERVMLQQVDINSLDSSALILHRHPPQCWEISSSTLNNQLWVQFYGKTFKTVVCIGRNIQLWENIKTFFLLILPPSCTLVSGQF